MDELIQLFNAHAVRYLLIGGQAMRLEGLPRSTMDWDFYVPPRDLDNIRKINELLGEELDVPLLPLGSRGENFIQTYQTTFGVVQFHLAAPGLPPFETAEKTAVIRQTERGTPVKCLAGKLLLASKKAANRPQDQLDIEFLKEKERLGKLD
jgi:hypothetical protein